jgi:hypothetical protein
MVLVYVAPVRRGGRASAEFQNANLKVGATRTQIPKRIKNKNGEQASFR